MKYRSLNIFNSIFSLFISISILGGGIIFLMFIIAIIVGGNLGTIIATTAFKKIMPYFIKAAAIGIFAGLIAIYTSGSHYLSLKKLDKQENTMMDY